MFHKINCPRCGVTDSAIPIDKYCSPKVICPSCSSIADKYTESVERGKSMYETKFTEPVEDEQVEQSEVDEVGKKKGRGSYSKSKGRD